MSVRPQNAGVRLLARLAGSAAALALTGCAHLVVLHDPLTAPEHNDLGVAYEAAGQPRLAAHQYHQSLRLAPHQGRVRVNLGNTNAARGRWSAAEHCYRRALRDSTTDADAMNNLAIALLRQRGKRAEARLWAERAVASGGADDSLYRATLDEVNRREP